MFMSCYRVYMFILFAYFNLIILLSSSKPFFIKVNLSSSAPKIEILFAEYPDGKYSYEIYAFKNGTPLFIKEKIVIERPL